MFTVTPVKELDNYGQFVIEPLENGFGHTLGNALRRVLLGSFKGAAITRVKVAGVTHKFSTLEGLSEDMVDLILNLKAVRVSYAGDESVTAKLSAKGPATVKAGDIVTPPGVKIVNPEAVVANLAKGAKLEIELEISTGYGYSPSEDRTANSVGELVLDAIFSPVERVSYKVESTRVGRRTDFDKLVMDIYTDGSATPSAILQAAANTLLDYFQQIVSPQTAEIGASPAEGGAEASVSIEELGLPTRIANALKAADFTTAASLAAASDKDLKQVKNLGEKSLSLIDKALAAKGYTRNK